MRTLVTGATGLIGRRVVERLTEEGQPLQLLCRPHHLSSVPHGRNIRVVCGDLTDPFAVRRAVDGCDQVIHLAACARPWARNHRTFYEVNVLGQRDLLRSCRATGVSRIVLTSTVVVFGPSRGYPVNEETEPVIAPRTEYERSKVAGDREALDEACRGLPVVLVHPTRVFGPGPLTEANSLTRMISLYDDGAWRWLLGDGQALGNYVFVDDVADGILLALRHGRVGQRYILGGTNCTLTAFFECLAGICGKRRLLPVPVTVARLLARAALLRARLGGPPPPITPAWVDLFLDQWSASSEKARRELGYRPRRLSEALEITIDWLRGSTAIRQEVAS